LFSAADATINQWNSPIKPDGTSFGTKGKPGSNLPIKLEVQDSDGNEIDTVVLTAFRSNKNAEAGSAVFTTLICENTGTNEFELRFSPTGVPHYACDWVTQDESGDPLDIGVYYFTIFSQHPNNDEQELLVLPGTPHCVGDLEETGACPDISILDPNNLPEGFEDIEDVVSLRIDLDKSNDPAKQDKADAFCDDHPFNKKCL